MRRVISKAGIGAIAGLLLMAAQDYLKLNQVEKARALADRCSDARGRRIIEHTPLRRFGRPDDLVGPALWLLSDEARFVHGATLTVDGGLDAYGGV